MVRFYCPYCKSYLTHDTASVRKSHLVGKNHIRLVADYYRNVSINEKNKKRTSKKKGKARRPVESTKGTESRQVASTLHCPTNKQKRMLSQLKNKDVLEADVLDALYQGSPGYERVFVPEQRMDIGHLLRVSKQPQRGNVSVTAATAAAAAASALPAPRTLAWSRSYNMKYHDDSLLHQSIRHSMLHLGTGSSTSSSSNTNTNTNTSSSRARRR